MKHILLSLAILAFAAAPVLAQDAPEPVEFSRRYDGLIGKDLTVTLLLAENNEDFETTSFNGAYYYHRSGIPIELVVEPQENGRLHLREEAGEDADGKPIITGQWDVMITDGEITGTWKTADGKKALPVALAEKYPEGSTAVRMTTLSSSWTMRRDGQRTGFERSLSYPQAVGKGPVVERVNAVIRSLAAGSIAIKGEDEKPDKKPVIATTADLEKEILTKPEDELKFDADFNYVDTGHENLSVMMNSDGFLTIESLHSEYTGGAHGNYGFSYAVIDLTTGDEVRLSDIATEGFAEKWAALGAAALRKEAGVVPEASLEEAGLFENKLELNDTWFLVPGGIGFSFDPYEIGSYARGQISFVLEWKDIIQDLKPGTKVHALASRFASKTK